MHKEGFDVKDGQQVTVTSDDKAEASSSVLPITYPHFAHMCQPGDTLFVGRYLVNGADQSSLYLEVGYIIRMPSPPLMASYRGLKPAIYVLNEFRDVKVTLLNVCSCLRPSLDPNVASW